MSRADLFDLIAHWECVLGMEKHVPHMKGFAAFYLSQRTPEEKRIIDAYHKVRTEVYQNLLNEAKGDIEQQTVTE